MFAKNRLLFLVLFLVGVISVLGVRVWQVKKAESVPFILQESSFSLQPPAEALTGKLVEIKGEVKKEPRDGEEFKEVEEKEEILDGEKLATGEDARAMIEFPDFAKISLGPNSEVAFVNMLPSGFLIRQSRGEVDYKLLQSENPLSVRTLHLLFTLQTGESNVVTDREDGEVSINQLLGRAKMALVDLENKTHVWEIEQGQRVLIDDEERRVGIEE